jgi:hypothetical protein
MCALHYSIMVGLLVCGQMPLLSIFVVTLVTSIPHPSMLRPVCAWPGVPDVHMPHHTDHICISLLHVWLLGLIVFGQIPLLSDIVVTMVTTISHSFMFGLLVPGQTDLLSTSFITLVTAIPHSCMLGLLHVWLWGLIVFGQIPVLIGIVVTMVTTPSCLSCLCLVRWICCAHLISHWAQPFLTHVCLSVT